MPKRLVTFLAVSSMQHDLFSVPIELHQDSDSDDDSPEAFSIRLSNQHAKLRLELDDLLVITKAKAKKDTAAKAQATSSIQIIRMKLRDIEQDPFFNSASAGKRYLEMQSKCIANRQTQPRGRSLPRVEPAAVADSEPANSTCSDSDDDMGLGLLEENVSLSIPAPAPTATSTAYSVRNVSVGNWTGRTPKQLLQDCISKIAKGARISYFPVQDSGNGFRAGCKFAGGAGTKKVDGVTIDMALDERVGTKRDAEEFVAVSSNRNTE